MARRRYKKRTHVGASNGAGKDHTGYAASRQTPKSMVLRMGAGQVGPSISQLVKDVRGMMEPGTATRLKERRSNKLKDYVTMAGPLNVSHLLLFSRSASGNVNLRVALIPRGPTLHFRVEKYSLSKDVKKAMKHPVGGGKEFLTAPLLVMNNFTAQQSPDNATQPAVPKHLESLATSIFQSLFPPISPQTTPLSSIRRVLLLNRELPTTPTDIASETSSSYTLNLRHYAITTKTVGLSKPVRRLNAAEKLLASREKKKKGIPNLGKLADVSDYLLDPNAAAGFTSGSESEIETDAEVEVLETKTRKPAGHGKREQADAANGEAKPAAANVEKRGVKLVELGPRMKLRMTKVEEGVCGGKVMWHEYISKTAEEEKEMEALWEGRRREKEKRKKVQKENVERKKKERAGPGKKADGAEGEEGEDDEMPDDEDEWDSDDIGQETEMMGE
ncbi:MAG: hypothetical protein M1833_006457 [Piccolia ochrophora]|nr:MAG: hypothetical protein M1833_006457 [Piccolia ochrophora]